MFPVYRVYHEKRCGRTAWRVRRDGLSSRHARLCHRVKQVILSRARKASAHDTVEESNLPHRCVSNYAEKFQFSPIHAQYQLTDGYVPQTLAA